MWPPRRSEATLGFPILTDSSVSVKFLFFSHRSSFELNSVSIVNQPVHNGIGDGRVPDMIMPMINRELAGDEGGCAAAAVFDEFQKISPFSIRERGQPQIVQDQQVSSGDPFHESPVASIRSG